MKRFSSNYLYVPQVGLIKQCVVETDDDGFVIRIFPLVGESASTSWLPGLLMLSEGDNVLLPEQVIQSSFRRTLAFDELPSEYINAISSFRFRLIRLYPFNFELMAPAEETRIIILE